ncbi:MAG TPA: M1 family aminopeptidase [Blastocatellia bacterium]|nr:M1 family aminopeptidase [Blastocatellia bacterium]HMX29107.1 M1 family aminopeptidase [Blastocatellia bacterium]HMY71165.1 M1 family aminopeptidase [Blastocatellia bacterium]HMZ20933.1 M1 family aminopeptidase [Blastocatellia bacterium]HNG31670.1 M1 family aminopeptidase [Blastocatellia bacterium]
MQVTNTGHEELDHLIFHLYPNAGLGEMEEPWLTVSRISLNGNDLRGNSRARHSGVRVDLPAKLAPGRNLELKLEFSARLPRVQREEASLLAHFLQEVNDAVNEEKPARDARDIFFAGEEAILLSYFHPILAVKPSQLSESSLVAGVGGIVFSEAADYEVKITTDPGLTILASSAETKSDVASASQQTRIFQGEKLRGFGLVIAERMKSVEQRSGQTRVVSYFREGDDRLGKRALNIATRAVEAYANAFGNYPYPILQVVEMPLPAGYSGTELPALIVLAQAYYIDFEAPGSTRLPGVLREQEDVIKSAFEFTLAHGVAHQWWGSAVGNDPERAPFVNEALSSYSAAYYHEIAYNKAFGERIAKQQLNGTYQAYRMLGGVDLEVEKPAKDFRSTLQFTAIVQAKGALLFATLRRELGDEKFFRALKSYYSAQRFRIVTPDQLRGAFLNVAEDPRATRAIFQRWLREKHGDEDIGAPDLTLMSSPSVSKIRTLGRVFVKIGKTAAKPF